MSFTLAINRDSCLAHKIRTEYEPEARGQKLGVREADGGHQEGRGPDRGRNLGSQWCYKLAIPSSWPYLAAQIQKQGVYVVGARGVWGVLESVDLQP